MAGTRSGGLNARETNIKRYGPDFYKKIGYLGGKAGRTGGFHQRVLCADSRCVYRSKAEFHMRHECAGYKGGLISRRTKASERA